MGRDSSVGIATRYKLQSGNRTSAAAFRTRQDRTLGPSSLLYNGYRVSFPGLKRPERGADHRTTSNAEVKERVELYLHSPYGPSWPVPGRTLPFTLLVYSTDKFISSRLWRGTFWLIFTQDSAQQHVCTLRLRSITHD